MNRYVKLVYGMIQDVETHSLLEVIELIFSEGDPRKVPLEGMRVLREEFSEDEFDMAMANAQELLQVIVTIQEEGESLKEAFDRMLEVPRGSRPSQLH